MDVTQIPAVSTVRRKDCDRKDEVDTSYPGVMQAVMHLAQVGMSQARNTVKYDSPAFAGELLLLAGLSLLASTDNNCNTNSCIDYKNLVLRGKTLPVQTIFVSMQDENTLVVKDDRSPVKSLNTASGVPDYEEHVIEDTSDTVDQSLFQSIPIDADEEARMEDEAERRQEAKFSGKPTAASDGAKLPKKLIRGKMRIPAKQGGLTGVREE